jgi:predicted TPR repeat methyltransferase
MFYNLQVVEMNENRIFEETKMKEQDHIANHDQFAANYNQQVDEFNSYGHDALFGMCFEYVKPGEILLDLGIGTGLSSIHFARVGLDITGVDGSAGMLAECRKKNFAKELKQYDIINVPLPYADASFHHVISCGLFHFFGELLPIFRDISRMLKPGGIYAFTVASPLLEELSEENGNFLGIPTAWGINMFKHTDDYIKRISKDTGFNILKQQKLLVNSGDPDAENLLFKIFVMRKS